MKLTYIYHSCFAIEGEWFTIILDYFKDAGGIVHDYLLTRPGKFYVMATHFHPDHFNPEVLRWKEEHPDIIYIFSKDILKHRRAGKEDALYLKKLDVYEDDTIRVKAYGSTDVGVSFLIEAEDKKIFHAGDLNNWHWNEESTPEEIETAEKAYLGELKIINKDIKSVDLAMFPVDPRLGKDYMRGAEQFVDRIQTALFVPMHFDEEYAKANAFKTYAESKGCEFISLTHVGQTVEF